MTHLTLSKGIEDINNISGHKKIALVVANFLQKYTVGHNKNGLSPGDSKKYPDRRKNCCSCSFGRNQKPQF